MAKVIKQGRMSLFHQPDGRFNAISPLLIGNIGLTGVTNNSLPGRGQTYQNNASGQFELKHSFRTPPTGLFTGSLEYDMSQAPNFLEQRARDQSPFDLYRIYSPCARLDNPAGWRSAGRVDYYVNVVILGGGTESDAPMRTASDEEVTGTQPVQWDRTTTILPLELSALDSNELEDLTAIDGLTDPKVEGCAPGYQGPDKHLYIATAAGGAASANVLYSINGSSFAAMTNDPFGTAEDISGIAVRMTGDNFRVVVSRGTTDAGAPAEVAFADVSFGAEGAATWTTANVGSTNGDVITVLAWPYYTRMFVAGSGKINVSTDYGATWTQIATGGPVYNAIVGRPGCEEVWFVGASNTIQREVGFSGQLETRVGPSGGGTFHSIAIAEDNTIFAGNGTSLFRSNNLAANTGGWSLVRNFGANKAVRGIHLAQNNSQILRVLVDDTTGGTGLVFESIDGGNTLYQIDSLANLGYNDWFPHAGDDNRYTIVGDADAAPEGVIHRLGGKLSGC